MKKLTAVLLAVICMISSGAVAVYAQPPLTDESIASAILIEAQSGKVLYEKEADAELIPASVTKVMTMLLIMEAIDSGKLAYGDMVTASANAASMGGSQVYLKEGEQFTVSEMLKCITMASANDACVAMAEHICGSEAAFVELMNSRAAELGMLHTKFENTNGLDDTTVEHYTSARDISIMSRELIVNHPDILKYTSVWMDTVRDGSFGLTNTNRLVRFYNGANGLKTGSTSKAGFCISASAKRDGMQLICVIMKAPTRDSRNEAAKKLLDYGFANYSVVSIEPKRLTGQKVMQSNEGTSTFIAQGYNGIAAKGKSADVKQEIIINDSVTAPLHKGDTVGTVRYTLGDELLYEGKVYASENIKKITYFDLLGNIFKSFLGG